MKKALAIATIGLALVGCGSSPEPDYDTLSNEVTSIVGFEPTPLSSQRRVVFAETVNEACSYRASYGHKALVQMLWETAPEGVTMDMSADIANAMNRYVCSRLDR